MLTKAKYKSNEKTKIRHIPNGVTGNITERRYKLTNT